MASKYQNTLLVIIAVVVLTSLSASFVQAALDETLIQTSCNLTSFPELCRSCVVNRNSSVNILAVMDIVQAVLGCADADARHLVNITQDQRDRDLSTPAPVKDKLNECMPYLTKVSEGAETIRQQTKSWDLKAVVNSFLLLIYQNIVRCHRLFKSSAFDGYVIPPPVELGMKCVLNDYEVAINILKYNITDTV
ncbi:hypothetical protein vseg_017316 [Gypsophila vaccaria]